MSDHQPSYILRTESAAEVKYGFGSLGLFTAYLLVRRSTRTLGLVVAIAVTVAGRIYPQLTVKGLDGETLVAPTAMLLVAAFSLGLLS